MSLLGSGMHLTPIDADMNDAGRTFYVVGITDESGNLWCVSDEDPMDDIRQWHSIESARSVARTYVEHGRVKKGVQITIVEVGVPSQHKYGPGNSWSFLDPCIDDLLERMQYPDAGSW